MFGAVEITKNVDTSNYQYSGYRICFDSRGTFSTGNINNGRNVIIFGADMSFSSHSTNKIQNIYVLGQSETQGINGPTIYAEKLYRHTFTEQNKKFVLSLHYNGDNSYLFVNGGEELKFKFQAFSDKIKQEIFCIGNLSSDWSSSESTKTGLYGNVYDFAVYYSPLNGAKTIYDIHRYLMKKHGIV